MLRAFISHGSNAVLLLVCLAALAAAVGGVLLPWPLVLGGAALFYASEYGTHRFLFHARPSRWGWLRRYQHRLHYDHHLEPSRLDLLFLPLWYVLPNAALLAVVFFAIFRSWLDVAAILTGASAALLHYEWVHYVAHIPFRPRTGVGRYMKKYHLWHHFKNERLWFGVSNPSMDFLYRTYRDPDNTARSGTTRVLFEE